jgi:hypothetical protein
MYNPPGGSLHEFIELQNVSGAAVDLSGMYFDGITFRFNEGTTLGPGARLVLGSNTDTNAWKAQYGGVTVAGWFSGNLNNAGERITLFDRFGNIITTVDYDYQDGWPTTAEGGGRSLEIISPNGGPDDPANWQASVVDKGTPGAANSTPPAPSVYLNEIMADNVSAVNHGRTYPDWIELHNPGGIPVNLTGRHDDDRGVRLEHMIPALGYHGLVGRPSTTPGLHTGWSEPPRRKRFLYDANEPC